MALYAGIDVGLDGAIARIEDQGTAASVAVVPMPTIGTIKRDYDWVAIIDMLCNADHVTIEEIEPRTGILVKDCEAEAEARATLNATAFEAWKPKKKMIAGGKGTAHLLISYGRFIGLLQGLGVPFTPVRAREWKRMMLGGRTGRSDKTDSIRRAQELFPGISLLATPRCRKPHDGMAEALLILECGRRISGKAID
jgi:hypothetical protein